MLDTKIISSTFAYYNTLAPLPLPSLEETCQRYLATVEPLVDAEAFAHTKATVEELMAPGGVGELLQAKLQERAQAMDNWLAGWWEDAAYLSWPTPLPINSSIAISADARVATYDQALRAADATAGALDMYLSIINETFAPDIQRDGTPLDMSLLKRFFATTRVPGLGKDRSVTYGREESRHIVVIRQNRFYAFDVLDENDEPLPLGDLVLQFRRIIDAADAKAATPAPIGVLTARERPDWARQRQQLIEDPMNRTFLDRVERALFHICLDSGRYSDFTALGRAGLHGSAGNRWFDKSLSLVIDADGRLTLHGEHSPVDAGAWCPLLDIIGVPREHTAGTETTSVPEPQELRWMPNPALLANIEQANKEFAREIENLDFRVTEFDAFGKELIKTFKMGPDPLIQMGFQLAYWRLHGHVPKTYEAASTRSCRLGRTETIRVASEPSKQFVMAMDDPSVSDEHKQDLLRAAFAEHSKRGRDASAGFGVDRHLLGLTLIAKEAGISELPRLFTEPVYTRGWELTTAQVPLASAFVNHFGPVIPQGYGIAYVIKSDTINLSVSSFKADPETSTERLIEGIFNSFEDIRALLSAGLDS